MNPPPLLVCFETKENLRAALDPHVVKDYWSGAERLIDAGLPPAVSARVVAVLFGFSTKFIGAMIRRPGRYYRAFTIRKGKKQRTIHAPRVALKLIQKWIGYHLCKAAVQDEHVFGFVPGRSAVQAAAMHCGAHWVYSLDIENFFPSTPQSLVETRLRELGYPAHGADMIGALCCIGGGLAQGSPASPVLSNLVFGPLDRAFGSLANELGVRYTRYADDIVFSGDDEPPTGLRERARQIVVAGGWKISVEKEHLARLPQRLKVHGLLVHGSLPRLTKGYRNRIRAMRHLLAVNRVAADDVGRFKGHLSFAESVERWEGTKPR